MAFAAAVVVRRGVSLCVVGCCCSCVLLPANVGCCMLFSVVAVGGCRRCLLLLCVVVCLCVLY